MPSTMACLHLEHHTKVCSGKFESNSFNNEVHKSIELASLQGKQCYTKTSLLQKVILAEACR